jgi:hypothetical protein
MTHNGVEPKTADVRAMSEFSLTCAPSAMVAAVTPEGVHKPLQLRPVSLGGVR